MVEINNRKPGRPKGSKNKVKTLSNGNMIVNVLMDRQIANTPTCNLYSPYKYIPWGERNDFPDLLANLYYNSSTHLSCVDFLITALCGNGVDADDVMPNYKETWESFINKIATDLVLYGGFAFQVIVNKDGKTFSYFHLPFSNVRVSKPDEDGNISELWVCKDWTDLARNKPFSLPRFGFTDEEKVEKGKAYMFYYSRYTIGSEYYPLPHYYSALKAIQTETELVRYDLKSVLNNFSANGVVTLDRIDDEQERKQVIDGILNMFTGSENSNTVMITFKNNSEDTPVTFTPFDKDVSNVNLFADNNDRTTNRILSAHKISNPTLIGLPNGGTGFANEGALLEASFNLLNKTLLNKMRKEITKTINKMFKLNGVDKEVNIRPLTFNLLDI